MRKYIDVVLIILLCTSVSFAGSGTSGFEFLRTDFSPRSSAMAGSYIAMRSDINGLFHNPAGLAYSQEKQVIFNYMDHLLDIKGGIVGYSQDLENIGRLSGAIIYFDYGSFNETDEFAEPTGRTFGASDIAFAVSLSNYFEDWLAYGVTLKYAHSSIDLYNASAFAMDFGLIYEAPFEDDLFLGVTILNLGQSLTAFQQTKESLPLTVNIGGSKKLAHLPLVLNVNLNNVNELENDLVDNLKKFSLGGEFTISQMLRLRLGYNNEMHSDLETSSGSGFSGVSLGLGFVWNSIRVDYSFASLGELGSLNRFGISSTF